MRVAEPARIYIIAGVNGAGKSSLAGAAFREFGGFYYNPDDAARQLMTANAGIRQEDANSVAWLQGVRLLKRAIQERLDLAFETTLGGNTITQLLPQAARQGIAIHVWYVGLSSPELHIQRVQSRVARGGHDIPEEDIRRRYEHSRLNLVALLPHLSSLRMFDNSVEMDPAEGHTPSPQLILHMQDRRIPASAEFSSTPNWAKPIVAAVLKLSQV